MNFKLLDLTPTHYLCPSCGEWHPTNSSARLGYFVSERRSFKQECPRLSSTDYSDQFICYVSGDSLYYSTGEMCGADRRINGKIPISSITENAEDATVTFDVAFTAAREVGRYECRYCYSRNVCQLAKLGDENDKRHMLLKFGFRFDKEQFEQNSSIGIMNKKIRETEALRTQLEKLSASLTNRENALTAKEEAFEADKAALQNAQDEFNNKKLKEATKMSDAKKTSIFTQFYEHSPKENVALVKEWLSKYQPVLRWAIPAGAVFAAYQILKSADCDLNVNNISETCEKKLGFKLEALENKRALKELLTIGGLTAGAYTAVKGISTIFGTKEYNTDISVEDMEAGMNQLEAVSNKFAWIQPKTEDLLPIAFSVILVYVTLHKPKFVDTLGNKFKGLTEDLQIRIGTYLDLAKLFIQDKFNMDLSCEEDQRKVKVCVFLVALLGIFAFLYGKKVLKEKNSTGETDSKNVSASIEEFIAQAKVILEKIAPTAYTTLLAFLSSKMILKLEETSAPAVEEAVIIDADSTDGDNPIVEETSDETDDSTN